MIVSAAIQAGHAGWALVAIVMSIVTLAYQLKLQKAFYAARHAIAQSTVTRENEVEQVVEPLLIAIPMVLLAIGCLALSLLTMTGMQQPFLIAPAAEVLLQGTKLW